MPKGWRTYAWHCAFVAIVAIPRDTWLELVGARWLPFLLAAYGAANLFLTWLAGKATEAK
jgi:hypothetical protein